MKRRMAATIVFGIFAALGGSAQAQCVTAGPANSARLTFDNVEITMSENIHNAIAVTTGPQSACDDGSVTEQARVARFTMKVDGVTVCDRTDLDPSFDPFLFGAGIAVDPQNGCGARFSLIGLTTVATPDPETFDGSLDERYATGGLTKDAITETPGEFWYGSFLGEVPQDSSGTVTRGVRLSG